MLTLRKITVPVGDTARAARRARYLLAPADSPGAFARSATDNGVSSLARQPQPRAVWLGSSGALSALGLERGRSIAAKELAIALQGRHVATEEQVRRPGPIKRVRRDSRGTMAKETARGIASLDLTFSAPKSVSVIWSQADPQLRELIEHAMLGAADQVLEYMTHTKPLVMMGRDGAREKIYGPACGFAGAAALHVTARRARGERAPAPQLHVHGVLLGAERPGGGLAGMESSALFRRGVPREGGAAGRLALATRLIELGFEIEAGTGEERSFFDVRGVPGGLIEAMSARSRDVRGEVRRLEAERGKPIGGRERAVVALKTREPKAPTLSGQEMARAWDGLAQEFEFGAAEIAALRARPSAQRSLERRRGVVGAAIARRLDEGASQLTPEAIQVVAFECAMGQLSLVDTLELLEDRHL